MKNWKKCLVFFTCACLFTGCGGGKSNSTSGSVRDTSQEEKQVTSSVEEKDNNGFLIDGNKITGYTGDAKEIATLDTVDTIASDAFSSDMGYGVNLEKVTITANIMTIEERAFAFTAAKEIYLEEGVEKLEAEVFVDSYIDEIWFPESIKEIGPSIMETEEGLYGTKIHVVKGSKVANYFEGSMPYGECELCYDYEVRD